MIRVYVSSVIDASADTVWSRVRDFNGLPQWHPAIADSRIENGEASDRVGCIRHFHQLAVHAGDGTDPANGQVQPIVVALIALVDIAVARLQRAVTVDRADP